MAKVRRVPGADDVLRAAVVRLPAVVRDDAVVRHGGHAADALDWVYPSMISGGWDFGMG